MDKHLYQPERSWLQYHLHLHRHLLASRLRDRHMQLSHHLGVHLKQPWRLVA